MEPLVFKNIQVEVEGTAVELCLDFENEDRMSPPLKGSISRHAQLAALGLAAGIQTAPGVLIDTETKATVVLGIEGENGTAHLTVSAPRGIPEAEVLNRLLYAFHEELAGSVAASIRFDRAVSELVKDVAAGRVPHSELSRRIAENRAILLSRIA